MNSLSVRELRSRIGCPLAILLTALSIALLNAFIFPRPLDDPFDWMPICLVGAPFAALALARTRDALAWLLAIGLTAAVWSWIFYPTGEGANIGLGFYIWFVPLPIVGLCVTLAGVRGRIPWARDGDDADAVDAAT